MYSDNYAGSSQGKCVRDIEEEIKTARKHLDVKQGMKTAMENLKNLCGTPSGESHVHFYALYGDMCFEVTKINKHIKFLLKEQEKN